MEEINEIETKKTLEKIDAKPITVFFEKIINIHKPLAVLPKDERRGCIQSEMEEMLTLISQ